MDSTQLLFFSPEMDESAQLSFTPKVLVEFLLICAKFPLISKFFGLSMGEIRPNWKKFTQIGKIRPNWKKFARNFYGLSSTARICPVRPKKYLL
jgi:hypothetical protein